jgi:hypothetical protein
MVRPKGYAPIHLSLEEVSAHAGHEVLLEVVDHRTLIVYTIEQVSWNKSSLLLKIQK